MGLRSVHEKQEKVMAEKRQVVLIVDDEQVNREILRHVLCEDFDILEAENGKIALDMLKDHAQEISMIILDLIMPVMDGIGFLEMYHANPQWENIPVLVATAHNDSEIGRKCFELGAWDFIGKPYNLPLLKLRISSAYARTQLGLMKSLQEAYDQLVYSNQHDPLTGLPNRQKFMKDCRDMFAQHPDEKFVMVRFDVENFRLINSMFSMESGNAFLRYVSFLLNELGSKREQFCYAHFHADVFVVCCECKHEDEVINHIDRVKLLLQQYPIDFNIRPIFGIYMITDVRNADPDDIYDKVSLASRQCKRNHLYEKNYEFYMEPLREQLCKIQEYTNAFSRALDEEQFKVYLQPKFELVSNTIAGSEALVRWINDNGEMISPSEFIPAFEQNGFILKLDYYMWEHVCMLLQKWIGEGKTPKPISVNVSRMDVYNSELVNQIIALVERYRIPSELFQLELTETAYAENQELIIDMMRRLQERGFTVLMDDFGSGYSSLNVLKDLPIDILKIDLKFLDKSKDQGKARFILDSIIRMSRGMSIPVIAEGVEDEQQARFLRSIGCEYAQGFFFARPMPVEEFEKIAFPEEQERRKATETRGETLRGEDSSWRVLSLKFNRYFAENPVAMALYAYDGKVSCRQSNRAMEALFGVDGGVLAMTEDPMNIVSSISQGDVGDLFSKLSPMNPIAQCEVLCNLPGGRDIWFSLQMMFISQIGSQKAILGMVSDITPLKMVLERMGEFRSEVNVTIRKNGVVLVIEPDRGISARLRNILGAKYVVFDVASGGSGLRFISESFEPVDAIILDGKAPGIGGAEFLSHVKKTSLFSGIPVVLIDGKGTEEADGYIYAPFRSEEVLSVLNSVLKKS